jgi:gluconate 2-dehydrogenase gamma chain
MVNRREWLRRAGAAAGFPLLHGMLPPDVLAWGREAHAAAAAQGPGALDDALQRVLSAACERIIPADETPGAVAAGVPRFIEHMLAQWYDPPERARVLAGLQDLDAQARARFGTPLADSTSAQQDTLLLELDAQGAQHWFATAKYLTIWGYYTSEVGVTRELQPPPSGGRYDGCAPYAPRARGATQAQGAGHARAPQHATHDAAAREKVHAAE